MSERLRQNLIGKHRALLGSPPEWCCNIDEAANLTAALLALGQ